MINISLSDCEKYIDSFLQSKNSNKTRFVNCKSISDYKYLLRLYKVDKNTFINPYDYANKDENIKLDEIYNAINKSIGNVFLQDLTLYLMLKGENTIKQAFANLKNLSNDSRKLIVFSLWSEPFLYFSDPRIDNDSVYNILSSNDCLKPKLYFVPSTSKSSFENMINGINNISNKIMESYHNNSEYFVFTKYHKENFPGSLYPIFELGNTLEILKNKYSILAKLDEKFGKPQQWIDFEEQSSNYKKLEDYFNSEFGSFLNLEHNIAFWKTYSEYQKWLLFIGLKLFDNIKSLIIKKAIDTSSSVNEFVHNLYNSNVSIPIDDKDFLIFYKERKTILSYFCDEKEYIAKYCNSIKGKEKEAIYYLTDLTQQEKELIIELLSKYDYSNGELDKILINVYPDLYSYLSEIDLNYDLLNKYFKLYRYGKLTNRIPEELLKIVKEQAIKREYNSLLPTRLELLDKYLNKDSYVYFVDALGVEFLSFIYSQCKLKSLFVQYSVGRSNLPTITDGNKDFINLCNERNLNILPNESGIKTIDDLKHREINGVDFNKTKYPIHLIEELETLKKLIAQIELKLRNNECSNIIIVSDHGASRLAVLSESENKHIMANKGEHSGRYCLVNDGDIPLESATKENGYWVIADYSNFKGGRKATVEVHGGATLEEVAVPVISISCKIDYEIINKTPKITFSRLKKDAKLCFYSSSKLYNISVKVGNMAYSAETSDNNNFEVKLPDLKKAGKYTAIIYSNDNEIYLLYFEAIKAGMQEKDDFEL